MPQTAGHYGGGELAVGCPAFTRYGGRLGRVREVRAGAIKADASLQPDHRDSTSHVASRAADRVTLAFDRDRLGDDKLDNPEDATVTSRTTAYATTERRS